MIYFIHNPSADAVKVGYSTDPMRRLGDLQTGSPHPMRLAGIIDGGRGHESGWHRVFRRARIAGEWFRAVPVLDYFAGRLVPESIACLRELRLDGSPGYFYKPLRELTPDESAKHLDSLQRGINKDCSRLHEWERFLFGIHGKERINQLRLEFPER